MSTRHVVRIKGRTCNMPKWNEHGPFNFKPFDYVLYEGAGGSHQKDLQKAQVFGWSKRAQETLANYRAKPWAYEVLPVELVVR